MFSQKKLQLAARSLLELAVAEDCPNGDVTTEALLHEHGADDGSIISNSSNGSNGINGSIGSTRKAHYQGSPYTQEHTTPIETSVAEKVSIESGSATFISEENLVFCGGCWLNESFAFSKHCEVSLMQEDGDHVSRGEVIARVEGPVDALLKYERIALNGVQRLSGVSTLVSKYIEAMAGANIEISDTRKTTPGYRLLEKYAVFCGGGQNHRFSLSDGYLIKDNHIAIAGSLSKAVLAILSSRELSGDSTGLDLVVECASLKDVEELLKLPLGREDTVLLDNFDQPTLIAALKMIGQRLRVEVSGGVTLESLKRLRGLDFYLTRISIGALTHSAPAADISMDLSLKGGE